MRRVVSVNADPDDGDDNDSEEDDEDDDEEDDDDSLEVLKVYFRSSPFRVK